MKRSLFSVTSDILECVGLVLSIVVSSALRFLLSEHPYRLAGTLCLVRHHLMNIRVLPVEERNRRLSVDSSACYT